MEHVAGSVGMSEKMAWAKKQVWTAVSQEGKIQSLPIPSVPPAKGQRCVCVSALCVGFQTSTEEEKRTLSALSEKHNATSCCYQLSPERGQQQPEEMTDFICQQCNTITGMVLLWTADYHWNLSLN